LPAIAAVKEEAQRLSRELRHLAAGEENVSLLATISSVGHKHVHLGNYLYMDFGI